MPVHYCKDCGNAISYTYSLPKFCSECGSPTSALKTKTNAKRKNPERKAKEDSDGYTDSSNIPHIEDLNVSVEYDKSIITLDFNEESGFSFGKKTFEPRNTSF